MTLWDEADLVRPMALRVAATLRLADHLEPGPSSVEALAAKTGTAPSALGQLLRYLASIDVVAPEADGYRLQDRGAPLLSDHPTGIQRRLDIEQALGRADLALASLLHSVRTASSGYVDHYGQPFWVDLAADPERHAGYDDLMGSDVTHWSTALIDAFDWTQIDALVDVGGGNGTLLMRLLQAFPHLKGTVLEQQATADAARAKLAAAGLDGRGEAIGGNFFDELPAGADAYLLVAVIHNWNDEAAASILRRCLEAAGDGRVLVVEKTGEDGASPSPDMDIRGLVYFGGRERTVEEIAELAATVGLTEATVHPAGDLSITELRRPPRSDGAS